MHFWLIVGMTQISHYASRMLSIPFISIMLNTMHPTPLRLEMPHQSLLPAHRVHPASSPLLIDTAKAVPRLSRMSSRSSCVCYPKGGTHAILCNGGHHELPSSQIFLASHGIFSAFLVSTAVLSGHPKPYILDLGSSVSVERIFSGGRDTISLQRASLSAETIKVLMLLKNRLLVARNTLSALLA